MYSRVVQNVEIFKFQVPKELSWFWMTQIAYSLNFRFQLPWEEPPQEPFYFLSPLLKPKKIWLKNGVYGYAMKQFESLNTKLKTIFKNINSVMRKMPKTSYNSLFWDNPLILLVFCIFLMTEIIFSKMVFSFVFSDSNWFIGYP